MTTMITAHVDSKKHNATEKVFSKIGLTISVAINLLIFAVAMSGGIPFPIGVKLPVARGQDADSVVIGRMGGIKIGIADGGKYAFKSALGNKFNETDAEIAEMFCKGDVRLVGQLPRIHLDPFDRMLVARAQLEGMQLLTHDHVLPPYGPFVVQV